MRYKFIVPAVFTLFTLTSCSKAAFEHNKGAVYLRLKDIDAAKNSFSRALINEPRLGVSRYSLAFSLLSAEQHKEAIQELDALITEQTSQKNLFKVYFAKAVVYSLIGELEKALDFYQKCLYIQSDSVEVKTNIELLFGGGDGEGEGKSNRSKLSKKKDKESKAGEGDKEKKEQDEKSKDATEKEKKDSEKKKNLSPQDIERILKELKQQEKKIRSQSYQQNTKGDEDKKSKKEGGKPW